MPTGGDPDCQQTASHLLSTWIGENAYIRWFWYLKSLPGGSLVEVWASEKQSFLYHEYHEFFAGHLRFVARSSWSFGLAIQRPKAWVDNVSCQGKNLVVLQYLQQQVVCCIFFLKFVEAKMVDCLHQYLKCVEDLDPPWTSDTRAKWHLVNLGESWHWLTGCDWPMTGLSYAHWLPPHAETLRSTGQWRPGPLVCHLWKCESEFFCRDFFQRFFIWSNDGPNVRLKAGLKRPCVILQSYFLRLPGFKTFSSLWFLLKGWQGMIFWGSESEKFLAEEKQGDCLVFGRLENRYPQSTCQWVFFFEGMRRLWAFWIWGSTSGIQLKDNFSTCCIPKNTFSTQMHWQIKGMPFKNWALT